MASTSLELSAEIIGDRKLMRQLQNLGGRAAKNAVKSAVRRGQTILKQGIRTAIPAHAKSIRKAVGSKFNDRRGVAKVGINIGKKQGKGYAPHGAIYVLGTGPRYTKAGKYTGVSPPHPVVQQGIATHEAKAVSEMRKKLLERIEREAK